MSIGENPNDAFVACWNEVLVPKWVRFRHLLSGNGKLHSDLAKAHFGIRAGERVLDVGCGFGESCLEIGEMVGPAGEVLGLDCTKTFLDIAEEERQKAGLSNVRFELGDAQFHELAEAHYDVAFSRFGVMFFQSAVMAMRNMSRALKPGGRICLIVWRSLKDNPCWRVAKEVALRHLPPPPEDGATCGPGPFSMAGEQTDRAMLEAAGFSNVEVFEAISTDVCIGRTIEEAIDYQILVGPSGEIVREAGELGQTKLPDIRRELSELFQANLGSDGGVYFPSSSWAIVARKPMA
jgi:SAM-dependent methyltransferase